MTSNLFVRRIAAWEEFQFNATRYEVEFSNGTRVYVVISHEMVTDTHDEDYLKLQIAKKTAATVSSAIEQEIMHMLKDSSLKDIGKKPAPLKIKPKKPLLWGDWHEPADEIMAMPSLDSWAKIVDHQAPTMKPNVTGGMAEAVLGPLKKAIPGFANMKAPCPLYGKSEETKCNTPNPRELTNVIIHLNDTHAMSRNWIADWLETLDLDLSFKVEDGGENE